MFQRRIQGVSYVVRAVSRFSWGHIPTSATSDQSVLSYCVVWQNAFSDNHQTNSSDAAADAVSIPAFELVQSAIHLVDSNLFVM